MDGLGAVVVCRSPGGGSLTHSTASGVFSGKGIAMSEAIIFLGVMAFVFLLLHLIGDDD